MTEGEVCKKWTAQIKIQNLSSVNGWNLQANFLCLCFTLPKLSVFNVLTTTSLSKISMSICRAPAMNFTTQRGWFFFRIYISVYKLRKMSNGIWCLNTLKNLAINDLPRITEWTCDEDLSWSFRLGLFEKVQFQKHKLIFANFCNEFISINFWRTIDSLLFCFAWVLTLLKEKMKQLPVITNYLSVS